MKTKSLFKIVLFLTITFSLLNCSKEEIIPGDVEVNNFVWGGMNAYYRWQGEVEALSDSRFSTRDQLNDFLGDQETLDLFNDLIYEPEDSDSRIANDFLIIEEAFDGIKTTSGIKANVMSYENGTGGSYLYVYDVLPNSVAAAQGVTRGMVIIAVNGTPITVSNATSLFTNVSFTISLGDYNSGNPVNNGISIDVSKTKIPENPIQNPKVFDNVSGQKIGYVQYNEFSPFYDGDLNAVFESFKSQVLNNLIVDLRYSHGGSIETATYLASMITGQYKNEAFARGIWNDKVMSNVLNENLTNQFTDEIDNGIINEPINSLGLTKVYFIVSDATSGPAEVLINGLKEYIDVILVGRQTKGITEASMTLYDSDDYTKTGDNLATSHSWALQPIVLQIENSNNISTGGGHLVDVDVSEDVGNLGVLGELSDPVLATTIDYIVDGDDVVINDVINPVPTYNIWNSAREFIAYDKMYVRLK